MDTGTIYIVLFVLIFFILSFIVALLILKNLGKAIKEFYSFIGILLLIGIIALLVLRIYYGAWIRVPHGEVALVYVDGEKGISSLSEGNYFFWKGILPGKVYVLKLPSNPVGISFYSEFYPPLFKTLSLKDDMLLKMYVSVDVNIQKKGYEFFFARLKSLANLRDLVKREFDSVFVSYWNGIFEDKKKLPDKLDEELRKYISNVKEDVGARLRNYGLSVGRWNSIDILSYPDLLVYKKALANVDVILSKRIEYERKLLDEKIKRMQHESRIKRIKELAELASKDPNVIKIMYIEAIKSKSKIVVPEGVSISILGGKGK